MGRIATYESAAHYIGRVGIGGVAWERMEWAGRSAE